MRIFERSEKLIGDIAVKTLNQKCVCLFGVGGVGGFVAEALIRSGVENLIIIDGDTVKESNFNRQIIATKETLNLSKVNAFYLPENADNINLSGVDYIIDAVDTVTAKIEIIKRAKELNIPVISCMGTGGKLDMQALRVADISQTEGCPLARVMRRELKARGIEKVKVVYSKEVAKGKVEEERGKRSPSSMIFVPAAAGLMIAREVILDLIGE